MRRAFVGLRLACDSARPLAGGSRPGPILRMVVQNSVCEPGPVAPPKKRSKDRAGPTAGTRPRFARPHAATRLCRKLALHGVFGKSFFNMGDFDMPTKTANSPVKTFRFKGCSASVFENHTQKDGRGISFFKVVPQKTYKDSEEFKTTNSFSRDDLPYVILALQRAFEFCLEAEAKKNREAE